MPAGAIFEASRATHGHTIAVAAWDEFDRLQRIADEDIYRAQALRELAEAMGG
jgi:hypothetical protein